MSATVEKIWKATKNNYVYGASKCVSIVIASGMAAYTISITASEPSTG